MGWGDLVLGSLLGVFTVADLVSRCATIYPLFVTSSIVVGSLNVMFPTSLFVDHLFVTMHGGRTAAKHESLQGGSARPHWGAAGVRARDIPGQATMFQATALDENPIENKKCAIIFIEIFRF